METMFQIDEERALLELFHQGELEKLEQAIESVIEEFVERGWISEPCL